METYTTTDYGLANWLVFNRITLIGTVGTDDESKKKFVFLYSDRIPQLTEDWGSVEVIPNTEPAKTCKKFFVAHSIIKKALKESLRI